MVSPEKDTGYHSNRSEIIVLVSQCGTVQARCSPLIAAQAALIEALQADQVRLRAQLVIRKSALQFEREDRVRSEAQVAGLSRRISLVRQVEQFKFRLERVVNFRPKPRSERLSAA